jgi:hypothetical protein
MLIHDSLYIKDANQELDWLRMDTKERYESNLKNETTRNQLIEHGWINNKFTYKFNSNGFRSAEFATSESIVFLGCSFTIGIGLPEDKTFASIVSRSLNLDCYNLGQGGSSNDTMFRLARHWVPKIKPKLVVLMSTFPNRYELKTYAKYINFMPHNSKDDKHFKLWTIFDENAILNKEKNVLAIESICQRENIKLVNLSMEKDFINLKDNSARDLFHAGIASHALTAENILSQI